jgi:molybdopterin-guanine dinucleotide biosynthesis protein A
MRTQCRTATAKSHTLDRVREPLGVVLAGGAGRRLGGDKPTVRLGGRALVEYPLAALREAVGEVVVVAKPATGLPRLSVGVWREPDVPVHPLAGIAWALRHAGGRRVLVCPVDLPFAGAALLRALATESRAATVAIAAGQPLLGRFDPEVAPALWAAIAAGRPARPAIAALGPIELTVEDPQRTLFNVNTREDLARAEGMLSRT